MEPSLHGCVGLRAVVPWTTGWTGRFLSLQLLARTVTKSPGKSATAEGLGQGILEDSSASCRVQAGQGY